jgi:hypothetical protein
MPTSDITADNIVRAVANGVRVGTTFTKGGQKYTCVGFRDYTNLAGHTSPLAILESQCVDCGAPFRFMTTVGALRRREVNRRCALHKRPGARVGAPPSREIVDLMSGLD